MAVKEGWRGSLFKDFGVGDLHEHPLGRTVTTTDNAWFTLLTQNTAPISANLILAYVGEHVLGLPRS